MVNFCELKTCREQADASEGSSGFFVLPSNLKKRQQWIDASGLSQDYLEKKGTFRICYKHFSRSKIRTDCKTLKLHAGKAVFCLETTFCKIHIHAFFKLSYIMIFPQFCFLKKCGFTKPRIIYIYVMT